MLKKIFLFSLILSFSFSSFSQKRKNKIKELKTAFITDHLDLNSNEAEKFWPIYNAYFKKEFQLRRVEIKAIRKKIIANDGIDNFSDNEASKILNNLMRIEDELYAAKKKMNSDLINVISTKKIIKLYRAEQDFNKKLLMRLRNRKTNRR